MTQLQETTPRQPTCYLMCGIIASGKSTWAKEHKDSTLYPCVIVNRDAIREMIHGGTYRYDKRVEDVVRHSANEIAINALMAGYDVVLDECHVTRAKRTFIIKKLPHNTRVVVVYCRAQRFALERRMANPRGLTQKEWESAINGMKSNFEPPSKDEYGIDDIIIYDIEYYTGKTVCLDFDGVLNKYVGWAGHDELYLPREGAQEFIETLQSQGYTVGVYSARPRDKIISWFNQYMPNLGGVVVFREKPIAVAYIDDRAICFNGDYQATLKQLECFEPYWEKEKLQSTTKTNQ